MSFDIHSTSLNMSGTDQSTSATMSCAIPTTSLTMSTSTASSTSATMSGTVPSTSATMSDTVSSTMSGIIPSTSAPEVSVSSQSDNGYIQEKLNDAQSKFEKACQQIVLLDQKIKDLEVRYKRAVKHKKNSFRYNLRLRLSVVTGVKMMYHHYASTKADELHRLHRQRHTVTREPLASASTDTSSDTREEA